MRKISLPPHGPVRERLENLLGRVRYRGRYLLLLSLTFIAYGAGILAEIEANAASLRHRPGWEKLTMACAALTGPIP